MKTTDTIKVPLKFKQEWRILTHKGVPFQIKLGPGILTGKWIWEEEDAARMDEYAFKLINKKFEYQLEQIIGEYNSENFFEDQYDTFKVVAYKSPQYKEINNRIKKFIKETEDYGIKNHGDKEYLWEWFWAND